MLQALSIVFALAAVTCMAFAIAAMVRGHAGERGGYALRLAAVICFAVAVVLNVLR